MLRGGIATLGSKNGFTVPTFLGMCCNEMQKGMEIDKLNEADKRKHEIS